MARAGHKYPLIVYRHMVSRWWTPMIAIGLGMFALAYSEYIDPLGQFLPWRWQLFAGIGGLAILTGLFFWVIRYLAYVQPHKSPKARHAIFTDQHFVQTYPQNDSH